MADADFTKTEHAYSLTAAAAVPVKSLWQLPNGKPAVYQGRAAATSGTSGTPWTTTGKYVVPKATGVVLLDGGRAFWDRSARVVTYRKNGDRDFFAGTLVGDAASADETCTINLGVEPQYDHDALRDPCLSYCSGTPSLGTTSATGFGFPTKVGGSVIFELSSTNEAQTVDLYTINKFSLAANPIVEIGFRRLSTTGGGAQDFNIGIASGSALTDFDTVTEHLAIHIDGGAYDTFLQSTDGTNSVSATDTTTNHGFSGLLSELEEWWFDVRDPSSVKIYRNGVRILSSTTFNISAAANDWVLIAHLEKTVSTGQFRVAVDWLRARTAEQ